MYARLVFASRLKNLLNACSFLPMRAGIAGVFSLLVVPFLAVPASALPTVTDYDAVPPLLAESAKPLIMLALSKDHQLFYKAFTDYDDLDADGVVDIVYKHQLDYAGYFDSYKCYTYDATNQVFVPESIASDKYCTGSAPRWSGNFLNWATMTRIDEVRKVLYGGYRSTDTATETVLERSYLANDAHSFAKYYDGDDLEKLTPFSSNNANCGVEPSDKSGASFSTYKNCKQGLGITLCNTTRHAGTLLSQAVSNPPLVRAVKGNFSLWAANERMQCLFSGEASAAGGNGNNAAVTGIYAASSNPGSSDIAQERGGLSTADYAVRVKVCVSSALQGQEDCKAYPNGNLKPVGILQQFGDDGSADFGLMTGTYKRNKSGGVLRKNISPFTDEVNVATDGTFKAAPTTGGIVNTINQFRLVNYQFNSGSEGTYNSSDSCIWGRGSFSNGECTNWGNPFAEIMLECYRYFAGKTPNTAFDADDSSYFSGLTRQTTWSNPQNSTTACSNLNVIGFNASTVSYDGDELAATSDLGTASTAQQLTKTLGDGEAITGKYYFVGENGGSAVGDNNQICTPKAVSDLGLVEGTCPDAPRLDGSFRLAGIAHHAHISDLRSDIADKQVVTTHGVTLSPALPRVSVQNPVNGKRVSILPACRNDSVGGNCAIVDFKIVKQEVTSTEARGTFYVNWEDSEQGGDYDQDMSGIVSYVLTSTGITISTDVFGQSTPYRMGFGFVVSGTTEDGFHVLSGINNFNGYGCTNCSEGAAAVSKSFTLGATSVAGSTVGLLEQPLYYAAKWGGFRDSNANNRPDLVTEWDRKNNATGATGADGIPDNYFLAINPNQLKANLTAILVSILERTASGTSAALVSNTGSGEGALFQALYNPRVADASGSNAVGWVGSLHAMFIDRWGNMREDNATPFGTLTSADNILDIYYDPYTKRTYVQRYAITSSGARGAAVGTADDVLKMRPIWSAREALGQVADKVTQRNYSELANTKRYIFTGVDRTGDGQIGFGAWLNEVEPFVPATFPNGATDNQFRLLGLTNATKNKAPDIINFIRGQEGITGFRSRTLDYDGSGVAKPWLLGDIVHSSPVSVGRPSASYDITYGDSTYAAFRQKYERRRQVVYVGANDGMLHAFNAGFYNPQTQTYELTGGNAEVQHPLGSELWAYVPYNLLPHLQWLTQADYPHVYYMDGPVRTFDVNIFPDDATHPGGWGTIIVVGMRFGGGDFTLDPNSDPEGNAGDDITLRSAFVIMDVTDPEQPPVLLGEITHSGLGYTSAEPTLVKLRAPDALDGSYATPSINRWLLLLGAGPGGYDATTRTNALNSAVSGKDAQIFVYDLQAKSLISTLHSGHYNAFIGGITAADWNRDFSDDGFYFGTVGGSVSAPTGSLKRGVITVSGSSLSFSTSTLLDTGQPFSATPLTLRDLNDNFWVYGGTGRFYVVDDNNSTQTQSYYGVKEPRTADALSLATVSKSSLINTTQVQVFSGGQVRSATTLTSPVTLNNGASVSSFYDVVDEVANSSGWYFDFTRARARNTTSSVISDQSLIFTEYQPSGLKCQPEGQGYLNAPHLLAGIPGFFAPIGKNASVTYNGKELVEMSVSLGHGSPSTPQIHQNANGVRSAIVQTSTGQITWQAISTGTAQGKRQSWREVPITW
jgi:type IV pilus assembly protein PilY1